MCVEILLKRQECDSSNIATKGPELAQRLRAFDSDLCTDAFLTYLKPLLPNAVVAGKLNAHRTASQETLTGLHPADRFLVELLKIDRLEARVDGMLYRVKFQDTAEIVRTQVNQIIEACEALKHAPKFANVLQVKPLHIVLEQPLIIMPACLDDGQLSKFERSRWSICFPP